jgi:hypothetical protein
MPAEAVRRLELDSASLELRRQLGPTAWMVFEERLLASAGSVGSCDAEVPVRALAARLGLAKNAIARAMTRLRRFGLSDASSCSGGDLTREAEQTGLVSGPAAGLLADGLGEVAGVAQDCELERDAVAAGVVVWSVSVIASGTSSR